MSVRFWMRCAAIAGLAACRVSTGRGTCSLRLQRANLSFQRLDFPTGLVEVDGQFRSELVEDPCKLLDCLLGPDRICWHGFTVESRAF